MLAGRNRTIKPQDILLLLKLHSIEKEAWRVIDLAHQLSISPSEITMGLERLRISGLINSEKRKIHKAATLEFLIHGLKYVFPPQLGTITRGIPTAHSWGILAKKIVSDIKYVWPNEDGDTKGVSVYPIYETAPQAALKDEKLHKLLALIDTLRLGRIREQKLAIAELEKEMA